MKKIKISLIVIAPFFLLGTALGYDGSIVGPGSNYGLIGSDEYNRNRQIDYERHRLEQERLNQQMQQMQMQQQVEQQRRQIEYQNDLLRQNGVNNSW